LEIKVVVSAAPSKLITEVGTKFVPFTVSVKLELPATVEVGETSVVVGAGFSKVTVIAGEVVAL
jgi:hypothetical protein